MVSLENCVLTVIVLAALTALVCVVGLLREAWTSARMPKPKTKYGYLVKKITGLKLPLEILHMHNEGWYIGTRDGSDYSQESVEVYATVKAAERALKTGQWTQRQLPIGRRAKKFAGISLRVEILGSQAGWYIGTRFLEYRSRESVERYSTTEALVKAYRTGQWTERPDPPWRVRRRILYRRLRQLFAKYFVGYLLRAWLWKEIISEGLSAGLLLFFLRWGFDAYLALLSGQHIDAVWIEKLSHFASEFIEEGYIYLVAGALLGSLVGTIVFEWLDAYLMHKAYYSYDYKNRFSYSRFWNQNSRIFGALFGKFAAQIAGVYLVLAVFARLDVWEKDYAAAVFGGLVILKVLLELVFLREFWGYAVAGMYAVFPALGFGEFFVGHPLPASGAAFLKFIVSLMLAGGLVGGVIGWARARGRPREQLYDAPFKVVASGLAGFFVSALVVAFFESRHSLFSDALSFAGGLLGWLVGYRVFYGAQAAGGSNSFQWGRFALIWGRAMIGYGVAASALMWAVEELLIGIGFRMSLAAVEFLLIVAFLAGGYVGVQRSYPQEPKPEAPEKEPFELPRYARVGLLKLLGGGLAWFIGGFTAANAPPGVFYPWMVVLAIAGIFFTIVGISELFGGTWKAFFNPAPTLPNRGQKGRANFGNKRDLLRMGALANDD
jgi:hypothetical protein